MPHGVDEVIELALPSLGLEPVNHGPAVTVEHGFVGLGPFSLNIVEETPPQLALGHNADYGRHGPRLVQPETVVLPQRTGHAPVACSNGVVGQGTFTSEKEVPGHHRRAGHFAHHPRPLRVDSENVEVQGRELGPDGRLLAYVVRPVANRELPYNRDIPLLTADRGYGRSPSGILPRCRKAVRLGFKPLDHRFSSQTDLPRLQPRGRKDPGQRTCLKVIARTYRIPGQLVDNLRQAERSLAHVPDRLENGILQH